MTDTTDPHVLRLRALLAAIVERGITGDPNAGTHPSPATATPAPPRDAPPPPAPWHESEPGEDIDP